VFHASLLLPGANKGGHRRFSRFGHALGLDQKQFAISKLEKWLATL
jgi:hypothetical protein